MLKKNQKKMLSWVITLALILSNFIGISGVQVVKAEGKAVVSQSVDSGSKESTTTGNGVTFDLIGITDFHGQLLDNKGELQVGAALAKAVKDIKKSNPDRTLIIGGGDLYQGTPVSNILKGVPVQQVMTNIGMEVTALGNHEFDWGLNTINTKTMKDASYEIVCANMIDKTTKKEAYKPYKVFTKDGVKIAVVGGATIETPTIVLPAYVENYQFTDLTKAVNDAAKKAREEEHADVVVATLHEGGDELPKIVNKLDGVDVVFGGHSHTTLDTVIKDAKGKDVPTMIAASNGRAYVDFKMQIDSNKKLTFPAKGSSYKALTVSKNTPIDDDCKAIVDAANKDLAPTFNEVIGTTTKEYTGTQADQPYGESEIGSWMADVIRKKANADVGMQNNGGVRVKTIKAGDINVGLLFNLMPFDNTICTTKMKKSQLKTLLEAAVQDNGKGIQISGVQFTYDMSKPGYKPAKKDPSTKAIITSAVDGERITSIKRQDGKEISDTEMLVVAAPDFLATGGDTFEFFVDEPSIKATFEDLSIKNGQDYLVRNALIEDVRNQKTITVDTKEASRIKNTGIAGPAKEMTISEARNLTSGAATITGTVTVVNGKNAYIQDDAAGMYIFNKSNVTPKKGDKIKVTGGMSVYNNLSELTVKNDNDIQIISSGNTVTPKVVKISEINEKIESQYIELKGVTLKSIDTNANSILEDESGQIAIYRMPELSGINVGDKVDVLAAVSQYKDNYQLVVATAEDVVKAGSKPVSKDGTIQILTTTDMHNRMLPWDYATNSALTGGSFAQVATGIKELRASNPNTVLIDAGDVCQDNSAALFLDSKKTSVFPMIQGMNALDYDAWSLGNHEFNYGMDKVKEFVKTSKAPVLCADVYDKDGITRIAKNYTIVERGGIKIGVIGLVTPNIKVWDAENLKGYKVTDPVDEVKAAVKELTGKVDIMIGAFHMGEQNEYGLKNSGLVDVVSACPELSMVIGGHMHVQIANEYVYNGLAYAKITDSKTGAVSYSGLKNDGVTKVSVTEEQYNEAVAKGVLIVEAGKFGETLGKVDLTFKNQDGKLQLVSRVAANLPMKGKAQDEKLVSIFTPYDKIAKEDALQVVGKLVGSDLAPESEVKGIAQAQLQPTAMIDLINKTQMYYGQKIAKDSKKVDVSAAAAFRDDANIKVGNIKKSDTALIYKYDNTLYVLDVTGKQLKQYMEWSAKYYNQYKDGDLTISFNSAVPGYNYDMFTGVKYDLNVSKPSGERIENLTRMDGTPIKDTDTLRLAVNNYRSNSQLTTYGPIYNKEKGDTLPVLVAKSEDTMGDAGRVRDLIRSYIVNVKGGTIKPECDNNWKMTGNNWDAGKRAVLVKAVKDEKISVKKSLDGKTSNGISLTWQDLLDGKIAKEAKVDANGAVDTTSVDTKGMNLITIKEEKPESKIQLKIPSSAMKSGTGIFALSTGTVDLHIPMGAIDSSKLKDDDTVQVSKSIMDANEANSLLAKKPQGTKANGKVFTFTMAVAHSDKTIEEIHQFVPNTPVAVTLNLTADDIKGMDTSNLAAFSFNDKDNKWEDVGGVFNQASMTFVFNTPHFTNFTIMERAQVAPPINGGSSSSSGGSSSSSKSKVTPPTDTKTEFQRIAGENRIETSIAIAKAQFADKQPDAVVLTSGDDFPDALSGSAVAYKFNAPLLLINKSVNESKNVLDYITNNLGKNKNIYILGGTGAVSAEVSDYLASKGYNMIRLGGKDRYETNQKIVDTLNVAKETPIVITSGNGFADALSISSVADVKGYPVLLNDKDSLSSNASNYIKNIKPTTVYVVGGTGVLSTSIEDQIKNLNANIKIVRVGGKDRYETSIIIADTFKLETNTMTVASGMSFPDALSGSVLAARKKSNVLLIDNNDITRQKDLLNKQKIKNVIVLGGEGVISSSTANSLLN